MEQNIILKQLRKSLNLSQSEFADKIGVSQGTIGDIERGRIGISKNVKSKIIEKIGIESGYFNDEKINKNIEINQGIEAGYQQELDDIKSKLNARERMLKVKNSNTKYIDSDTLTNAAILEIWADRQSNIFITNLSNERFEILSKLLDKQTVISDKVIATLSLENDEFREFRKSIIAIQSFQNLLDNITNSHQINRFIKVEHSARKYPNQGYLDFKEAMTNDFIQIKDHVKSFIELSKCLKSFADAAKDIPEAIHGIDPDEFKDYIEMNK